jgi:hypothetical protein
VLLLEMELPGLSELREQGLLSEESERELAKWFRASSNSPQGLDLPEPLYLTLAFALKLHFLDPQDVTMH